MLPHTHLLAAPSDSRMASWCRPQPPNLPEHLLGPHAEATSTTDRRRDRRTVARSPAALTARAAGSTDWVYSDPSAGLFSLLLRRNEMSAEAKPN